MVILFLESRRTSPEGVRDGIQRDTLGAAEIPERRTVQPKVIFPVGFEFDRQYASLAVGCPVRPLPFRDRRKVLPTAGPGEPARHGHVESDMKFREAWVHIPCPVPGGKFNNFGFDGPKGS